MVTWRLPRDNRLAWTSAEGVGSGLQVSSWLAKSSYAPAASLDLVLSQRNPGSEQLFQVLSMMVVVCHLLFILLLSNLTVRC